MNRMLAALAPIVASISFFAPPGSPPEVVDTLSDPIQVGAGAGWGRHPDTSSASVIGLVEGPLTPPLGRGSLSISAPTPSDIALAFAVPTGAPGQDLPTPVPWSGLSASYATYTADGADVASRVPTLRLVGYQSLTPTPTGFTTLSFEPSRNGTVEGGVWQTWELGPDSIVIQSNASDGFCTIAASCTLSEFAAQYPGGGWGMIQVGIGSGAPAGAVGFADAVLVRDGTTAEYFYDFEVPASAASTASIAPGAATATGGAATVTLVASAVSATPTVSFTIATTLPDGTMQTQVVEVDAGTTSEVSLPVPFGVTRIVVTAQDAVLSEGDVTFTAPPPPTPPPPTPPVPEAELPPTGANPAAVMWGAGLLAAGLSVLAAARVRAARARVHRTDRVG